ncbi:MAG: hypothetical protein EXS35_06055 [Pedosphaera sp.]|nr:hypothetical protein [Pedosphaera sp.]
MSKKIFIQRLRYLALGILFFLTAESLRAQTNAIPNPSGRFLFVVDTSAAMRRRAPAVETAVGNLLRSSMSAQLQRDDSVGLWTYNDQLFAGQFPLQRWTPENSGLIASNTVVFLKARRYQGESKFGPVVQALDRLIKESDKLTILLVSDGDEVITGTPYDAQIRQGFQQAFDGQKKARMPFVTVLRASRGRLVNASVNLAPWPVMIPDFPPEPQIVEAPKPPPPPPKPVPRPTAPSLILVGKKPVPPAVTNLPPPTVTNSAPTAPAETKPSAPTSAAPAAPVYETNQVAPVIAETTVRPGTISPTPPMLTPSALAAAPKTAEPAPTPPKPEPVPTAPIAPRVEPPPPPPTVTPAATVPPVENKPPAVAAVAIPAPAPPAVVKESPPEVSPKENIATVQATNPPSPVVVAVATEPAISRWPFFAIGAAMLLLAVWFFFVLRQRSHKTERVSLITRSLDRERK